MSFLLPWLLFPYLLALLMPSWRWLVGCMIVVGGFFAVMWGQHWIVSLQPGYQERIGTAIGLAVLGAAALAFVSGATARAITLSMVERGWAKAGFTVNVLGFAFPVAFFTVPMAWEAWRLRPPSESCSKTTFNIAIADSRFAIPVAPVFNVYLGKSAAQDAYYLGLGPSLRDFCSLTRDGRRRTRATNLWIRFEEAWRMRRTTCAEPIAAWAVKLCAAMEPLSGSRIDDTDFPISAHIYALNEVAFRQFLGTASTYGDSVVAVANSSRNMFVQTNQVTADGKPLTYDCDLQGSGGYWCTTSYPWQNGTHITYVFRSGAWNVAAKGLRLDATLKEFLAGLQTRTAN